ncbi:MAG: trypsin-like peptidase domain-containing protein [Planctomycetia bacterium]|nr:trypsin-like peptidase domain-containing protein [Planctomycetia bacterium]
MTTLSIRDTLGQGGSPIPAPRVLERSAPTASLLLEPQAGRSLLSNIYKKNVESVVYVTGVNVLPEKKSELEFFAPPPNTKEEFTVGTGFIIHEEGYVLTNAHTVVRSVAPIIELHNGKRFDAEIVALFPHNDLALLKIDTKTKLTPVTFENNEEISVGETIVTIGCPHGLKYTLTYGVISGMNRSSQVVDIPGLMLKNLLQTDAAINPGSSGGPWFNLRGAVTGVTVSKRSDADNIGFGISISTLHEVLPQMLAQAVQSKFSVGFKVVRDRNNGPFQCRVESISSAEGASAAGLSVGDVIHSINGKAVFHPLDFYLHMLSFNANDEVALQVFRAPSVASSSISSAVPIPNVSDGQDTENLSESDYSLEYQSSQWVCVYRLSAPELIDVPAMVRDELGMEVSPLDSKTILEFGLRTSTGVVIRSLDQNLYEKLQHPPRSGDILARIDYQRPKSPEHLARILQSIPPDKPVDLVILRMEYVQEKKNVTRIDISNWRLVMPAAE